MSCCCKTFPRAQNISKNVKLDCAELFVAKYIINENENFYFSAPVLVGVGEAIYSKHVFGFEIRICDLKIIQFLKVMTLQNFSDIHNNILYEGA